MLPCFFFLLLFYCFYTNLDNCKISSFHNTPHKYLISKSDQRVYVWPEKVDAPYVLGYLYKLTVTFRIVC